MPSTEEGQEVKKINVPEFTGDITLANSELNVQNLRMRVGDSDIKGEGRFNLDTYAYSVNAEGKNIDLAQVASAASESLRARGQGRRDCHGAGQVGQQR